MFNLPILDIAISLSFLYCLLSLFATVAQELFASMFRLRGRMLFTGLKRMLDDGDAAVLVKEFYAHPLVAYMARDGGKKGDAPRPSYLSKATFLTTFRDLLRDKAKAAGADTDDSLKAALNHLLTEGKEHLPASTLAVLQAFWREAEGDVKAFEARVGEWFDDSMARVSGWYKRQAQVIGMVLGLAMALLMNVDTLAIAKKLAGDSQARQALTAQATAFVQSDATRSEIEELRRHKQDTVTAESDSADTTALRAIDSLSREAGTLLAGPITSVRSATGFGWFRDPACDDKGLLYPLCLVYRTLAAEFCAGRSAACDQPPLGAFVFFLFFKVLGYAATAFAIALGAPFWFDLLSRLVKLRGTGKKPEAG